jgi:hypothetical protein
MKRRTRNLLLFATALAVVAASVAVTWTMVGVNRGAAKLLDRGPAAPSPTARDAAEIPLSGEPVRVTIKQRSSGWLPGGKYKLHLDDITGRQVLVSVTEDEDRVVQGPKSVKPGDTFTVGNLHLTVVRLENLLVGSGDFGEFDVSLTPPATRPAGK